MSLWNVFIVVEVHMKKEECPKCRFLCKLTLVSDDYDIEIECSLEASLQFSNCWKHLLYHFPVKELCFN